MKKTHYDNTNGKILGWYDPKIHKEIPSPNIEITDEKWQIAIDDQHNHITSVGVTSLVDFRTDYEKLEDAKILKLAEIESDYNAEITADISYMSKTFNFDNESLELLGQNLSIGSVPTGFYWRALDNSNVPMTYTELQGLGTALQERGLVSFGNKSNRKDAVNSLPPEATIADVEAI
jgi:hypothetical protein